MRRYRVSTDDEQVYAFKKKEGEQDILKYPKELEE
jgi:hypothetical protein